MEEDWNQGYLPFFAALKANQIDMCGALIDKAMLEDLELTKLE